MEKFNKTIVLCLLLSTSSLYAMGSKRPSNNASNGSSSNSGNSTVTIPAPTINMGPALESTAYLDAASLVGDRVDNFKKQNELLEVRNIINQDQVDQCFDDNNRHETFSEQVSYYLSKMFENTKSFVGVIGSYYGTSSNDNNYFPVSMIRHPLCSVSSSSLATTLGSSSKVPDATTIARINKFVVAMNNYRQEAINGNAESKKEMLHLWSTFYSCLAYSESLSTADSTTSQKVAAKYAPSNFRKPAGVEFYEDPAQSAESRLNIGMYQFTPNSSNNIQSCLKAWNEMHKEKTQCQLNLKGSQSEMILATGSSLQSFNAFCGVHKMIQTFSIQVNTTTSSATHPNNLVNGKLKSYEERCVSPHFKAGKAYVHFGPFMNSTGSNLSELFSCIDHNAY